MNDSMNKYGLLGKTDNQMTIILNRIERQLGLSVMPLPDGLKKDDWAAIIQEDTLPVFSQFFPYKLTHVINPEDFDPVEKWFYIDKNLPAGTRILGIKDLDWLAYKADARFDRYGINIHAQDWMSHTYALDDIALSTVGADMLSLFDLNIYIVFEYPNKMRLETVNGSIVSQFRPFPLVIFVEHPSIMTISPTMMEGGFFDLCKADVATAIYQVLKYYDGMDTVWSSLSLQLDTLQTWTEKRADIIEKFKEAAVTTANENAHIIITV